MKNLIGLKSKFEEKRRKKMNNHRFILPNHSISNTFKEVQAITSKRMPLRRSF